MAEFILGELSDPDLSNLDCGRSGMEPVIATATEVADDSQLSGFEPELGGALRQKAVYVDEMTCIGCRYCSHVARNTFYIEPDYGRSRAIQQDGDPEELIQEAIETCPVDCINWVSYAELEQLEEERKDQVLQIVGMPVDRALLRTQQRRNRFKKLSKS